MKDSASIFTAAVVMSLLAGSAYAQTNTFNNTGLIGDSAVEEANEDLADDIEDDFERETFRLGNEGRPDGFTGSVSLRAFAGTGSSQADNDETTDLGVGANFTYVAGVNGFDLGLNYRYAESDGETDQDDLLYSFQYTRDFSDVLYGFAMLQGTYEGNVDDDDDDRDTFERENDAFLGLGAGYRVLNTPDQQWSVQAGPGYRFASFREIGNVISDPNGDGDDIEEFAIAISSDYYQRINETVGVTNDTDVIWSDSDTVLYNDLALNVSMSDALALRTSLLTEYHTDPAPGNKSTEHLFGVSLVYSLN